jgi:hypothetical protein
VSVQNLCGICGEQFRVETRFLGRSARSLATIRLHSSGQHLNLEHWALLADCSLAYFSNLKKEAIHSLDTQVRLRCITKHNILQYRNLHNDGWENLSPKTEINIDHKAFNRSSE